MAKTLDFSPDLKLPDDAVTQTFAFLARKGAGKTYGAGKLVEELHANGDQVVVIDPVGVWYGLRLAADGKKLGIPIAVFGGLHGDIPLEPTGGALVAKTVVDRGASVVLDLSQFRKNDRKRFVVDFAEELFHRKKANRSPMHLVVEEAQVFVPQRVMGDEARMLGAFEDLVKLGRNFGIGVTLISQRPQSVNKDALNQTECLVVLQTNGAQERKAIEAWIVEQGLDVGELVDTLPRLERGEAWVWSPSWLGVTKRIRIGKKWTFDASATPERGVKAATVEPLDPVALDELAQAMAATIERAKAEDPKALRQELAKAQAEIVTLKKAAPPPPPPAKVKRLEVPILKDGQLARIEKLVERAREAGSEALTAAKVLADAISPAMAPAPRPAPSTSAPPSYPPKRTEYTRAAAPPRRADSNGDASDDASVGNSGLRRMLTALAQRPQGLTNRQLGIRAGVSSRSGTFSTYLSRARSQGWIDGRGTLKITDAGLAALGPYDPLPEGSALAEYWLRELGESGASRMLRALLAVYPAALDASTLGEQANISHRSGTFSTYLSRLRGLELVEGRGELRASEELVG